jgi:hypothetical protein
MEGRQTEHQHWLQLSGLSRRTLIVCQPNYRALKPEMRQFPGTP